MSATPDSPDAAVAPYDAFGGSGLRLHVTGPVGWLVFDRPRARNAMDATMLAALPRAWESFEDDPAVHAVVVTGTAPAFQTGLDVVALAKDPHSLRDSTRRTREAALQLTGWHLGTRKPVIAAVNGVCAGGGLHFVVDADIVLATPEAYFTDPHVSVGQVSSWEAIGLMRRMPASAASSLALMGRHLRLDAARAQQLGLVGEIVPTDRLLARAQELGEAVAANPAAVARRHALWAAQELGLTDARMLSLAEGASS